MQEISERNYIGRPGELVQITATVSNGAVSFLLDGNPVGTANSVAFNFAPTVGTAQRLSVFFVAPPPYPATCSLAISMVATSPGGNDIDVLSAHAASPNDLGNFRFQTVDPAAFALFGGGNQ